MEHNHQHNLEHPSKHNEGHAMNMPPKGRTLKDFIPLVVIFFVVSLFTAPATRLPRRLSFTPKPGTSS